MARSRAPSRPVHPVAARSTTPRSTTPRRGPRRWMLVAAGLALAVSAVSCGDDGAGTDAGTDPTTRSTTTSSTTTSRPAADDDAAVTASIELPSTVRAGGTIDGVLVLRNDSGTTVDLRDGCTPKWTVVLTDGTHPPDAVFTMECGTEPFPVRNGTTRLPFSLRAAYPAGRYDAVVVSTSATFPAAPPVAVTVTP